MSPFWSKLPEGVALLSACWLVVGGSALAHIKNEASQFPDIEFSKSRFDIVVLVGAGIIPETPVFEPDKPLSKRELASWAALSAGLGTGGETPDTEALAEAALDEGIVATLAGEADYGDLNTLFFDGQLMVGNASGTPTKAEAASFMAQQLNTGAGRALLHSLGLRFGSTGTVTAVESQPNEAGGSSYVIAVGDTVLPMYLHGRVANGPTDLLQWQGREIRRSFVRGQGDEAMWIYLEAEALDETLGKEPEPAGAGTASGPPLVDRALLYALIAAVLILGLALFFRRRRRG